MGNVRFHIESCKVRGTLRCDGSLVRCSDIRAKTTFPIATFSVIPQLYTVQCSAVQTMLTDRKTGSTCPSTRKPHYTRNPAYPDPSGAGVPAERTTGPLLPRVHDPTGRGVLDDWVCHGESRVRAASAGRTDARAVARHQADPDGSV